MMVDAGIGEAARAVYPGYPWSHLDSSADVYMLMYSLEADISRSVPEIVEGGRALGFSRLNLERYLAAVARRLAADGQGAKALMLLGDRQDAMLARTIVAIARNPRSGLPAEDRIDALHRARTMREPAREQDRRELWRDIASGLFELGRRTETAELFIRSAEVTPDDLESAIALMLALARLGATQQALLMAIDLEGYFDFEETLALIASTVE